MKCLNSEVKSNCLNLWVSFIIYFFVLLFYAYLISSKRWLWFIYLLPLIGMWVYNYSFTKFQVWNDFIWFLLINFVLHVFCSDTRKKMLSSTDFVYNAQHCVISGFDLEIKYTNVNSWHITEIKVRFSVSSFILWVVV